jgi:hypothetical protein
VYCEEQQLKAEEEKRLAQEVKLKRRREILETWEHYMARCKEVDRCVKDQKRRPEGGEWEPIKIPHRNLAYIPNQT